MNCIIILNTYSEYQDVGGDKLHKPAKFHFPKFCFGFGIWPNEFRTREKKDLLNWFEKCYIKDEIQPTAYKVFKQNRGKYMHRSFMTVEEILVQYYRD